MVAVPDSFCYGAAACRPLPSHPLTECPVTGNLSEMSPKKEDKGTGVVTIRLFGSLRALMRERGLPVVYEREVPREGKTGFEVAAALELPDDRIEAVFRNGLIQGLEKKVFPADRVAFVPRGTPGPYRVLLGMVGDKKGPKP